MLINISQNILNNNVLLPFIVNPLEREEASLKLLMLNMGRWVIFCLLDLTSIFSVSFVCSVVLYEFGPGVICLCPNRNWVRTWDGWLTLYSVFLGIMDTFALLILHRQEYSSSDKCGAGGTFCMR